MTIIEMVNGSKYLVDHYPKSRVTVITDITDVAPGEYADVSLIWLAKDGIFNVFTSVNVDALKDLAVKYGGNL